MVTRNPGRALPHAAVRIARAAGVLLLVGLLLFALRHPLLVGMARFLIVEETPAPSDVIIALGGGSGHREVEAARLFRAGYGGRVILTGGLRRLPGLDITWADLMAKNLAGKVPDSLVIREGRSTSTFLDATYTLEDLRAMGVHSAIVVTDPYHLRRAGATFRHVFRGAGIRLCFVAPEHSWFKADGWWESEDGEIAVTEEYLKMLFYLVHYRIGPWS